MKLRTQFGHSQYGNSSKFFDVGSWTCKSIIYKSTIKCNKIQYDRYGYVTLK